MPTIHDAFQPITPATLDRVERRIGRSIPAVYREFLLAHNGGWPEPGDFEITHGNERMAHVSVDWFFPVDAAAGVDLEEILTIYRGRYPEELFPFACDPGGNLICIAVTGEKAEQIWFWDHEEEVEEGEDPGWDNLYYVAPNFSAFLERLKDGKSVS